jgi:hypothetical protein
MASFITELSKNLADNKNIESFTNTANNLTNTASSALETATNVKESIQGKPTLEDSVREALLQVIVNPKFSEQIESDIATVFRPILKLQLEKVGKIIANADKANTLEEAKAVKTEIETEINNDSVGAKPVANSSDVGIEINENVGATVSADNPINGGSKRKGRAKGARLGAFAKSLKKFASRGRRTTRRHKRTSR